MTTAFSQQTSNTLSLNDVSTKYQHAYFLVFYIFVVFLCFL